MAITRVQSAKIDGGNTGSSGTFTLAISPTAGNCLVVSAATLSGPYTCGLAGASGTPTAIYNASPYTDSRFFAAFVFFDVPAGVTGVTLSSGTFNSVWATVTEFSGVDAAVDVAGTPVTGGYTDPSCATGSISTTNANDLLIACFFAENVTTFSAPTNGFTLDPNAINRCALAYNVVAATGAYSTSATKSQNDATAGLIFSLQAAVPAVPGSGAVESRKASVLASGTYSPPSQTGTAAVATRKAAVSGSGTSGPATFPIVATLLYDAFRAARVLSAPGRGLSAQDNADGLTILNDLVDEWSARRAYSWAQTFSAETLTPGHQPHLLGPGLTSPDFAISGVRPVEVEGAALILNDETPNVDIPMKIRDAQWWANQRVKPLISAVPTDLYYEPDVPNGALYLWPVPNTAYGLRLDLRVTLAQFASANSQVIVPPACYRALVLSVAEEVCLLYGKPVSPLLARQALEARVAFQANNALSPRAESSDIGTRPPVGGFNYMTGMPA